jgi:two-component system sensor histidine kinase TtrS
MESFRVLNRRHPADFPSVLSTLLYPEWPFSKVRHTSTDLAQQVAVALLRMPSDHEAAVTGLYAGWSIPMDYQPVHELLQALRLPPYDHAAPFTLTDAIARYWGGFLLGALALLVMALLTLWVTRLNQGLARAKARLEQQHELILNSVADGICGVDLEGRTTFANRAMERITGWAAEELIAREQHPMLHHTRPDGTPHPPGECPIYLTCRDSRPRFVQDDLFWRKDGSSFPVEYSANPIRDERGATLGSVVVFRDVTERERAAEDIRRRQTELAHVGRLSTLGEMASGIAHELNQPLTAIRTNARACVRLLESGRTSLEHCSDVMERIAAQAERAGEVIRHIRHFVRKEEPQLRPARVSAMFETVLELIRPDARRAGVTLEPRVAADADWVLAQDIQIEQVILNLARNAIEAMDDCPPDGRRLTVSSQRLANGQVEIQVADTGPGLSAEVADRVFEPFVTTKTQGLGLGLSISGGIVQAHGDRLQVDSLPGQGTRFRFRLPPAPEGAPHEP